MNFFRLLHTDVQQPAFGGLLLERQQADNHLAAGKERSHDDFPRCSPGARISDQQSVGQAAVSIQYKYTIPAFCVVDEDHDSHPPTLDLRAMTVPGAFAQGYLKAADRAEFSSEEPRPIMQNLTARYIKKGGTIS